MSIPAATALFLLVCTAAAADDPTAPSANTSPASKPSPTSANTVSGSRSTPPDSTTSSSSRTVAANTSSPKRSAPPATATDSAPTSNPETLVQANDNPSAGTTNVEVMAEVVALRAEVVALKHLVEAQMHPPAPEPTPAEAAIAREKERADERIVALREQRSRLDEAVAAGLDRTVAAPAIARLDSELRAAEDARLRIDQPMVAATIANRTSGPTLSFDLGVASAYAHRGLNVFAADTAQDAHGVLMPAVTATFGDSGVTLGYWGAYQLNGDNAAAMVDAGLGAESDFVFGWSRTVGESLTVGAGVTAYLYPFADADTAGTASPVYVEPSAHVVWSKGVDLGMQVAAMYGVQEALAAERYVYVRPTIGRTVALPAGFSLLGAVGGGAKVYFVEDAPSDNVWDASADLALNKVIADSLYVRPSAHAVWTNYEGRSVGESAFGWFGVNVGGSI